MFDPVFTRKFGKFVGGKLWSINTSSGKLCWANMRRRSLTVCAVVVEDICLTLSHLE